MTDLERVKFAAERAAERLSRSEDHAIMCAGIALEYFADEIANELRKNSAPTNTE